MAIATIFEAAGDDDNGLQTRWFDSRADAELWSQENGGAVVIIEHAVDLSTQGLLAWLNDRESSVVS